MHKNLKDLTNKRFNKLTILKRDFSKSRVYWICKCDCGNIKSIASCHIISNKIKSCGCLQGKRELNKFSYIWKTRLYKIWGGMKYRVGKLKNYTNISICEEWLEFKHFYNWAIQNGYSDKLTIDRIDGTKGYYPDNCRWVNYKIQNNNRRNNRLIVYNNEIKTLSEWADKLNIKYSVLSTRLNAHKWSVEKSFNTPVRKRKNSILNSPTVKFN